MSKDMLTFARCFIEGGKLELQPYQQKVLDMIETTPSLSANKRFKHQFLNSFDNAPVYVVAGNINQAKDYIHVKGLNGRGRIVTSVQQLFGTRDAEVHLVGNYYGRKDIGEIMDECRCRNAKVTVVEDWR